MALMFFLRGTSAPEATLTPVMGQFWAATREETAAMSQTVRENRSCMMGGLCWVASVVEVEVVVEGGLRRVLLRGISQQLGRTQIVRLGGTLNE